MRTGSAAEGQPRLTLCIVKGPEPRIVPQVTYADGTVSETWKDWHREAAKQRPDLYEKPLHFS